MDLLYFRHFTMASYEPPRPLRELDLHKCKLCLLNVVEDTDHISTCPALASEHVKLQTIIEQKLRTWHIPSVEKEIESLEEHTCKSWFSEVCFCIP